MKILQKSCKIDAGESRSRVYILVHVPILFKLINPYRGVGYELFTDALKCSAVQVSISQALTLNILNLSSSYVIFYVRKEYCKKGRI